MTQVLFSLKDVCDKFSCDSFKILDSGKTRDDFEITINKTSIANTDIFLAKDRLSF